MKAKLLLLSGFVAAGLFGCIESDNYIIFTDYVTMEAGLLPDTMVLDSTYNIPVQGIGTQWMLVGPQGLHEHSR